MLFIDVTKAFDQVRHTGLLHKLQIFNFPVDIYLLRSYLRKRKFRIKWKNHLSSERTIQAGVPQGSILGPILYLIYTADFPINRLDLNSIIALYDDDTAIITKSKDPNLAIQKLQNKVEDIENCCTRWKFL